MILFIEDHRMDFGVESICKVLPVAPSSYYANLAIRRDPGLASNRTHQDVTDSVEIRRIHDESRSRYGARKVWHQLRRENKDIARCTVERLMKVMGLQGVVRGKQVITTNPDASQPCPDDKVNREFKAQSPNQLWVSDFTYVSTWQGMVYVAFVVDVFSRRIVGWRVSTSMTTAFVLDALKQAICQRSPEKGGGLIHHSDRGSQYLSIKYSERLADAGIFKTEVTKLLGPWKSMGQLEWETLKWVDWYNTKRLHSAIGYVTPHEAEEMFYETLNAHEKAA